MAKKWSLQCTDPDPETCAFFCCCWQSACSVCAFVLTFCMTRDRFSADILHETRAFFCWHPACSVSLFCWHSACNVCFSADIQHVAWVFFSADILHVAEVFFCWHSLWLLLSFLLCCCYCFVAFLLTCVVVVVVVRGCFFFLLTSDKSTHLTTPFTVQPLGNRKGVSFLR